LEDDNDDECCSLIETLKTPSLSPKHHPSGPTPASGSPSMAYISSASNNNDLVDNLVRYKLLHPTSPVVAAMKRVDRGWFVPPQQVSKAYLDEPFLAPGGFHLSAPHLYAQVLEALDLKQGLSFLNLGSGTGYLSYIVAAIVSPTGRVDGIEQHQFLAEFAANRCSTIKELYALNFCNFIAGDAFRFECATEEGYDRIYIGGGVSPTAVDRFQANLKVSGVLVAPRGDELVKIERISQRSFRQTVLAAVRFASLTQPDFKSLSLLEPIDPHIPLLSAVSSQMLTLPRGISVARQVL